MMQHSDNYDSGVGNYPPPRRRRCILWVGVALGMAVIGGGLFMALGPGFGSKNKGYRASATQESALRSTLTTAMNEQGLNSNRLNLATSYQSKALDWLLTDPKLESYDRSQVLQRFTMACFYYATNGIVTLYTPRAVNWKDSTGWLSQTSECEWLGIQCSTKSRVNGIALENNGLTGGLPQELIFLKDHLTSIDLTTNFLYMNGDDFNLFSQLGRLETLLMDDNYLSTSDGLPTSFMSLLSLKKLRMSYNLFGGSLSANMVKSWPKLTHLEIESNFLEGKLPDALGNLGELVYLYVRRNSLSGNLDFLKLGKMSNLCTFWLSLLVWFRSVFLCSHMPPNPVYILPQSPCGSTTISLLVEFQLKLAS
jgi:hypothetical protein